MGNVRQGKIVEVDIIKDMRDFDRLPRKLRDHLNESPCNWSAQQVLQLYNSRQKNRKTPCNVKNEIVQALRSKERKWVRETSCYDKT